MPFESHPPVIVEWIDTASTSQTGWIKSSEESLKEAEVGTIRCQCIGWLIKDTPDEITICMSRTEHGTVADFQSIPRPIITRIRHLRFK
jgi:hypothetical protein